MKKLFTLLLIGTFFQLSSQVTLFPYSTPWKYLDNGTDQGTAWYGTGFNDAAWASGNAELGYGDGDEATVVSFGPSSTNKYPTTYFRKTISVPSVATYTSYTINFRRDDGIIIYINGVEVLRNNMPLSGVNYLTYASTNCIDDGGTVISATLPASVIVAGTNVIAAEVHQTNATSSDLTFTSEFIANTNFVIPQLVKGPYLQVGTQNSMRVRWETNTPVNSQVTYGTNSLSLSSTVTVAGSVTSHNVLITGLIPFTKYYYSVGTSTSVIQQGADNYFVTSPVPGTPGNYRFWVTGDCGNQSTNQANVKNQYLAYTGTTTTHGWLLLGDNAYSSGTNSEYDNKFFNYYETDIMKKAVLWPAPGNHDYNNGSATATTVPYYSIFSTPTAAQAGGVASNNPAYYSYDYGNIHFISLDSYGTVSGNKMYDTLGAQAVWLKADLAANTKRWTVAYWHHPPYTMGSHNSDSEGDLANIRLRFIRILERNKVDLILVGHSHDYERSKLIKGHYGNEASFNATTHNLSTQSGIYDGTANSCPYLKDSINAKNGTVYVVSGSAGQLGGTQGSFPHNAMHYSNATNGGSLIMDIQNNRLDAKWLCADGVIRDKFTIFKDVNSVKSYTVLPASNNAISASWPGNYVWSNAAISSSISVSPTSNTTYWVKDPNNCVADTFAFKVLPAVNFNSSAPYCSGNAISFNDLSTNSPVSWNWSVNPTTGVTISSPTAQNPTFTFANTGTYSVTLISNNAYGPGLAVTNTITVNASPNLTANASSSAVCSGQTATLSISGASTYTWNTSSNASSILVSPTSHTTYTVNGTDVNGCMSTKTISVISNPNPTVSLGVLNAVICSGQNTTLTASGANNYTWNPGSSNATSISVSPTASQTYTLTGKDLNGCSNFSTTTITVNTTPTINAVSTTSLLCIGQNATLTVTGANTYTWNPGGAGSSIVVNPGSTTNYTVTGTASNGCTNVTNLTQNVSICTGIEAIKFGNSSMTIYPNPNNGTFTIDLNGNEAYTIEVFNIAGQLIHHSELQPGNNLIQLKTIAGMYQYNILKNANTLSKGKIIVQ